MIACLVDLETTGTEASDQIIEIGSYLVDGSGPPMHAFHAMVAPTIPIPPVASAVHHITADDLLQAPTWAQISATWFAKVCHAEIMVAHYAAFEKMHLAEMMAPRPWVCTYKCAMRAWPDAPGFGNQVLRYWLNPKGLDRNLAKETHRALPDAYVTAFIFRALLAIHPIETLIQWSDEIPMPPVVSFGKHKGKAWRDLPFDYLEWLALKSDFDPDTKAYAEHWMNLSRLPKPMTPSKKAETYLQFAAPILLATISVPDLNIWWKDERDHRAECGIVEGTDAYAELVAMCAARKLALSTAA